MPKKIMAWAACAFLAFYVITNPTDSAGLARTAGAGIVSFAAALAGGDR